MIKLRDVRREDISRIVDLDERVTRVRKEAHWGDILHRHVSGGDHDTFFIVAEREGRSGRDDAVIGFIVGEVRSWEFGSQPCGWIYAINVDPRTRLKGVGERLFEAMEKRFKALGIRKIRTMVDRKNRELMGFFRSAGMMAGPYIQLEKDVE